MTVSGVGFVHKKLFINAYMGVMLSLKEHYTHCPQEEEHD
jgi:hypothetical protein